MKYRNPINKKLLVFIVCILLALVAAGVLIFFVQSGAEKPAPQAAQSGATPLPEGAVQPAPSQSAGTSEAAAPAAPNAAGLPGEMRAMWISFLEWENRDISTEAGMRAAAAEMFGNCADMGLNTVMVAVRPFSDALYRSEVYPWSHLLTGTQGADPGYDPLAVLVEEAHARGLRIEAWINPYRVQGAANGPDALSEDSPAAQNPGWVREAGGLWFDPGLPEVRALVVAGVEEIVRGYDVDGIHFDDYFYPEFTAEQREAEEHLAFDAAAYEQYGAGEDLAAWRRENVNTLIRDTYSAIKAIKPGVSFGISPQGNDENNYTVQYSDVGEWMKTPGYVDYVMPQLYWGFGYRTAAGKDTYAFEVVSRAWAAYPRDASVKLYAGLGAYRIGVGDGGSNDQAEWSTGRNLTAMAEALRGVEGFSGFSLFRYDFLYASDNECAPQEVAALTALLNPPPADASGEAAESTASGETESGGI